MVDKFNFTRNAIISDHVESRTSNSTIKLFVIDLVNNMVVPTPVVVSPSVQKLALGISVT